MQSPFFLRCTLSLDLIFKGIHWSPFPLRSVGATNFPSSFSFTLLPPLKPIPPQPTETLFWKGEKSVRIVYSGYIVGWEGPDKLHLKGERGGGGRGGRGENLRPFPSSLHFSVSFAGGGGGGGGGGGKLVAGLRKLLQVEGKGAALVAKWEKKGVKMEVNLLFPQPCVYSLALDWGNKWGNRRNQRIFFVKKLDFLWHVWTGKFQDIIYVDTSCFGYKANEKFKTE